MFGSLCIRRRPNPVPLPQKARPTVCRGNHELGSSQLEARIYAKKPEKRLDSSTAKTWKTELRAGESLAADCTPKHTRKADREGHRPEDPQRSQAVQSATGRANGSKSTKEYSNSTRSTHLSDQVCLVEQGTSSDAALTGHSRSVRYSSPLAPSSSSPEARLPPIG
jgi:hypothetical protein